MVGVKVSGWDCVRTNRNRQSDPQVCAPRHFRNEDRMEHDGPAWRVTEVNSSGEGAVIVQADLAALPICCPKCGSNRRPRRYGALNTSFRDAPFLGRQVLVTVNAQRFRCADCGQAFFQQLTDMDCKRRITARCANYSVDQAAGYAPD